MKTKTIALAAAAFPTLAGADPWPESRLTWGGGINAGYTSSAGNEIESHDDGTSPSLGFDVHVGRRVRPRLALGLAVQLDAFRYASQVTVAQTAVLATAQYWLWSRGYVKGATGYARVDTDAGMANLDLAQGLVVEGALGYELASGPHRALHLEARGLWGSGMLATTLGVGVRFY
jgi:hypothetical protein